MYIYHVFITHSSVDGYLSCFSVLAVVNSAAVNIRVHVSFLIMFYWGIYVQEWDCLIIW